MLQFLRAIGNWEGEWLRAIVTKKKKTKKHLAIDATMSSVIRSSLDTRAV